MILYIFKKRIRFSEKSQPVHHPQDQGLGHPNTAWLSSALLRFQLFVLHLMHPVHFGIIRIHRNVDPLDISGSDISVVMQTRQGSN